MNYIIKIIFLTSLAITCKALDNDNFSNEEIPPAADQNISKNFDFNDAISQEIENYNNNLASEIFNDEHDSNNNITTKNAPVHKPKLKLDLKYVLLTIVNKITAKHELFLLEVNKAYKYKNITLNALSCHKSENNEFEDRALIKITENTSTDNQHLELFSGWLFARSSLTSLTHPIYDITLSECRATTQH